METDKALIEILACPKCHGALTIVNSPDGFGCQACKLLFKTEDNIPNFIVDEAVVWNTGDDSNDNI